ncbi:MAG: hypothetical protein JSW50_09755 [Candidatus Latescibacterota bacterium]|nr:MAG: hypothetical protein JSW50_09755 [Candidatus Latescibacterota bacterium]
MPRFKAFVIAVTVLVLFAVGIRIPQTISSSGLDYPINMSLQDTLLAVSDPSNGVHIFDVGNPADPVYHLHIPLAGNTGTALKDNVLYANEYGLLHVFRLNENSYEMVKTFEAEAEEAVPFFEGAVMNSHSGMWGCSCYGSSGSVQAPEGSSTGSSYAKFAVVGSHLYYLHHYKIVTMDITTPEDPVETSRVPVGGDIETLFPSEDYLFVGGRRGMYILDRSDPAKPVQIGRVEHFEACDPVVVRDALAFVTLRGGNACGQTQDLLLSVDIRIPSKPVVLAEKPLKSPYGLTVNENLLYVSSGRHGFGLLDVADPVDPVYIETWPEWPTKDFIWHGNTLFVLGFGDLRIFDVSAPENPLLLSSVD